MDSVNPDSGTLVGGDAGKSSDSGKTSDVSTTDTPDVSVPTTPPKVISTVPKSKSVITDTTPDIRINFNRDVVLPVGDDHLSIVSYGNKKLAATLSYGASKSQFKVTLVAPKTLPPGEGYSLAINKISDTHGNVLDSFYWSFQIKSACGDGVCQPGESKCNCGKDCGYCAGCCEYLGTINFTCHPGTAKNKCGRKGQSCGVCVGKDQCIDGKGCG